MNLAFKEKKTPFILLPSPEVIANIVVYIISFLYNYRDRLDGGQ
jgi:hypothetical protein